MLFCLSNRISWRVHSLASRRRFHFSIRSLWISSCILYFVINEFFKKLDIKNENKIPLPKHAHVCCLATNYWIWKVNFCLGLIWSYSKRKKNTLWKIELIFSTPGYSKESSCDESPYFSLAVIFLRTTNTSSCRCRIQFLTHNNELILNLK